MHKKEFDYTSYGIKAGTCNTYLWHRQELFLKQKYEYLIKPASTVRIGKSVLAINTHNQNEICYLLRKKIAVEFFSLK